MLILDKARNLDGIFGTVGRLVQGHCQRAGTLLEDSIISDGLSHAGNFWGFVFKHRGLNKLQGSQGSQRDEIIQRVCQGGFEEVDDRKFRSFKATVN